MFKYLILFLFVSFSFEVAAQSSEYDIVLFGKSIGDGEAVSKQIANGKTQYKLFTKAEANVMFKKRTSMTDIDLSYDGKTLTSCKLDREKDGELQHIEIIYENGKHYFIEDGKKQAVKKPITYTTTQLFFEEPIGVKEVYVERLNIFAPLEYEGDGVYKTVVDGGDNYYRYENGVLVELRIKKGVNIYMNKV